MSNPAAPRTPPMATLLIMEDDFETGRYGPAAVHASRLAVSVNKGKEIWKIQR